MSTTSRYQSYTGAPNQDNTARDMTTDYQEPVYAASIALKLQAALTIVKVAQLTGALAITAETTRPQIGDILVLLFAADGTARTVTPGAGFGSLSATTVVVAINKKASLSLMFDGATWVETSRSVGA